MSKADPPPPYEILLTRKADRAFDTLPKKDLSRIDEKILALSDEPRPAHSTKLKGHDDLYRVRSGDYRIVYEVDDAKRVVTILVVGNRKDVYEDF